MHMDIERKICYNKASLGKRCSKRKRIGLNNLWKLEGWIFTTFSVVPIHYNQRIHSKSSEITWHIGIPFVVMMGTCTRFLNQLWTINFFQWIFSQNIFTSFECSGNNILSCNYYLAFVEYRVYARIRV